MAENLSSLNFYSPPDAYASWLETQVPRPARHSYRFSRDWEYLREQDVDEQ